MSANILPGAGYLSSNSRTTSDMQAAFENANSFGKELVGGATEGATLSIASNVITPVNEACVFPIDAAGGGTVNLINVGDIRDGEVITVHSVNPSNPITILQLQIWQPPQAVTFRLRPIVAAT